MKGAIAQVIPAKQAGTSFEAVIILPAIGKVKVLNDVGARIWQLLDGVNRVEEVVAAILREYAIGAVQAQGDVLSFLDDLMRRGVVQIKSG